ncbi:MAG: hypothetical protein NC396_08515 [Bacteroides sp.]|nr:hypothetical protein [Bacteroides sp.]
MSAFTDFAMQAGGNLLGMSFQQAFAKKNMKDAAKINYEYGEKAADAADARTRALFTDLASPQAKVQQLKDAGLNVGLAYGGTTGGGMGAGAMGGGAGGQQGKQPQMSPIDYMGLRLQSEQAKNLAEDTRAKKIENDARESEAGAQQKSQTQKFAAEAKGAENLAENIAEDTKNKQVEREGKKLQNRFQELLNEAQDLENVFSKATLQDRIAGAAANTILITRQANKLVQDMRIAGESWDKQKEIIDATKDLLEAQAANVTEAMLAQKFQNELNSEQRAEIVKQIKAAARAAEAGAKNEEEFRERFDTELKQRKKEMWMNGITNIIGDAANVFTGIYGKTLKLGSKSTPSGNEYYQPYPGYAD